MVTSSITLCLNISFLNCNSLMALSSHTRQLLNTKAASVIQDAGAIVHYLPPYSPDFNPIEEAFSKVKPLIMNMESSTTADDLDIDTIVLLAFASTTSEDCKGWILKCSSGIYN